MHRETVSPLIAVVGPTGSGKSALALQLATSLDGEIVNCDSLQIYRFFDIGTAKLPPHERAAIPHHLIDIADPTDVFTAGDYARLARQAISGISSRHHLPILAGGTGFYLNALLHGLAPGPSRDDSLRARLSARENLRPGSLHRILRRFDPPTAARIHANDVQKLIRAVEICLRARRPASQIFEQGRDPLTGYRILQIGINPPRASLYDALNRRSEAMFRTGLLTEVRTLLAAGVSHTAKPFQSLGYKQALAHIRGELTLEKAIESTQIETRHYAKRQWTWFRRDPQVQWIEGLGGSPEVFHKVLQMAQEFI
ncbi:MAG: tRNA (adenosine(37)-N6)-dimethylallyltransferase MiaA [Bryobacteraceae bacterium]